MFRSLQKRDAERAHNAITPGVSAAFSARSPPKAVDIKSDMAGTGARKLHRGRSAR
jgi:hypothetical protein